MKRLLLLTTSAALFALPVVVGAQTNFLGGGSGGELGTALQAIITFSNNYIIPFLVAIGFVVFVWGMFLYFIWGADNDESKEKGKSVLIYTIVGFTLIFVFWGLLNIVVSAVGLGGVQAPGNLPEAPQF